MSIPEGSPAWRTHCRFLRPRPPVPFPQGKAPFYGSQPGIRQILADDKTFLEYGIGLAGIVNDFLETIVGNDIQAIHGIAACALAIGQAQPPADGLLHKRTGVGCTQGDDGIEVGNVPAFFQHIDVDDNFHGIFRVFHGQQTLDDLLTLAAAFGLGVDDENLSLIASFADVRPFQQLLQTLGVLDISGDDKDKRFNPGPVFVSGIGQQGNPRIFMDLQAVFQFDAFDFFGRALRGIKVKARDDGRLLDKAVRYGLRQGIFINDIAETVRLLALLDLRRCRQLQPQQGMQFIEGFHTRRCPIAVGFVHDQHQIIQPGQIVKITGAQILRKTPDARQAAPGVILGKTAVLAVA